MALAYLLAGNRFEGLLADLPPQKIHDELQMSAIELGVPLEFMFRWADSIRVDGLTTLPDNQRKEVPSKMAGPGFTLMPYQFDQACWSAARLGSVLDDSCGVGKTAIATAAAITAARLGFCKAHRCYVIASCNAIGTWDPYLVDLKAAFKEVVVYSVDSLHHLGGLQADGGAIIFDEVHKCKNSDRGRTARAHVIRQKFEWAVCMTGTFLHTGCDAIMSVLDLACPGLARFIDVMDFGKYFNAIYMEEFKAGGRTVQRQKLGIPARTGRDLLVPYLARACRSLSFDSPEVAKVAPVPPQHLHLVNAWQKPEWACKLYTDFAEAYKEEHPTAEQDEINKACPYLWVPDVGEWEAFGALLLAEWEQNGEILLERLEAECGVTGVNLRQAREWVYAQRKKDTTSELLKELETLALLPNVSAAGWTMKTEGRDDRILERFKTRQAPEDPVYISWRWRYAPGKDRKNRGYGPKLRHVISWLDANPDEPLVVGCASKTTYFALCQMLTERGATFHAIRGGVPVADRRVFIKEFQAGKVQHMVLQQVAGSESVNLIRARYSMLVDIDRSPSTYSQFLGRTRRVGQTRETNHTDLCFGDYQTDRTLRIRGGVDFDTETRKQLERTLQSALKTFQNRE